MKTEDLLKGVAAIIAFGILIGSLIAITKHVGENGSSSAKELAALGLTLLGIAAVIVAMGVITFLLGQLKVETLAKGVIAVGFLSAFVAGLVQVSKGLIVGKNGVKALGTLVVMIIALTVSLIALSFIDTNKLIAAGATLGIVIGALALAIKSLSSLKPAKLKQLGSTIGQLLVLTVFIGALAGIIAALSNITNPAGAVALASSVILLLGACTGILIAMDKMKIGSNKTKIKNITNSIVMLTAMAMPLGLFAIILSGMSIANTNSAIENAIALSLLMGVMTLLLTPLSKMKLNNIQGLIVGIGALAILTAVTQAMAGVLASMSNIDNAINNATALSILMGVMTTCLIALGAVGQFVNIGMVVAVASMALLTAISQGMAGVLASMDNLNNALFNAMALGILIGALTDCLVKLSLVSPLLLVADVALAGLLGVIAAFGTFATAVGGLMTLFPKLEEFLNKGLPILEKISTSIGTILGNLVASFASSVSNALPIVGQNIASFIKNVSEAGSIDPGLGDSLKKLAEAVLYLTAAEILDAITSFLTSGDSFVSLGTKLSDFAKKSQDFINIMSKVNPSMMDGVKSFAEAVQKLSEGNFLDSLTKIISFGKKDLGSFGNSIGSLANGLSSLIEKTKNINDKDLEHSKKALEVFKEITEVANDIPNEGGPFINFFVGDNKLDDFASKFYKLGEGLRDFVWQLNKDGTFGKYQVESAKKGMEAFKAILEVANDIPNEGGAAGFFAGENDIYHFAEKLWKVGEGLRDFVWQLNKDGVFDETAVQRVWAAKDLLWAIVGISDIHFDKSSAGLEELGARLSSFAGKIGEYVGKFKDVKDTELSSAKTKLEKVVSMFTNFAKMETELEGTSFDNISGKIEELGARLASFAGKIGEYVGKFKDVKDGDLTSSKTKIEKIFGILSDLNEGLKNAETTSLEDFSNKLSNFTVLRDILWTIKDLQEVDTSSITGKLEESAGTLTNFSNKISEYLRSMSLYTLDDISSAKDKIDKIVELVKAIANMTNGEQQMDLDLTSSNIETLGARLISFSNKLSEFLKNMEANVTAEQITSASTKMTSFIELVKSLAGVDFSQIEMTENQMTNLKTISEILWAIKDIGEQGNLNATSTNIEVLGDKLNSFAEKFKQFVAIMKNDISSEDVEAAKTKITSVIEMVNGLKDIDMESISTFGDNLKTFAESSLDQFITGLQNKDKETSAIDAIKALVDAIIEGIGAKSEDVKTAGTDMGDNFKTALEEYDTSPSSAIYAAGIAFVQGFVNGINDNAFMATNAGKNLGDRALIAAKNAIDSNSPSKETLKLGNYFGQGFVIGIGQYADKVYDESYSVADKAKIGLSKAISKVSNLISDGIDDDITIRPVLDLSNIESGAAAINDMFNTPSIGITSNLNAISNGMRNSQNNETEMVTAIDRLSKNLGNTNSNTYNINGITYDDGTEVSEAVRTLVRAARIERRT